MTRNYLDSRHGSRVKGQGQQPTKILQLPTTTVNDPDQPTTSVVWLTILFIKSTKNSSGMYYNDVCNADHGWAPCVEWMEGWWVGAPAI